MATATRRGRRLVVARIPSAAYRRRHRGEEITPRPPPTRPGTVRLVDATGRTAITWVQP